MRDDESRIYPCPQQVFIYDFGDAYVSVLGEERGLSSYPFKTWIDLGLKPATGSDAPVCRTQSFPQLYSMMTRKTWKGTVMDARERVSIEEALQAYTEFGAFSQKVENVKGRLIPGQLADIAVFSVICLEATPEDILDNTQCDLTIRGGEIICTIVLALHKNHQGKLGHLTKLDRNGNSHGGFKPNRESKNLGRNNRVKKICYRLGACADNEWLC